MRHASRFLSIFAVLLMLVGTLSGPVFAAEAEAVPEPQPTTADRIDAWFGTYISGPLWDYFIAVPLFRSQAVEVYHGDEASAEAVAAELSGRPSDGGANIVTWVDETEESDGRAVLVPAAKQQAAMAYLEANGIDPVTEGARSRQGGIPFIVIVLLAGGLFFTLRFGLVHLRMFGHGLACTLGRYDDPRDKGEISHFQALSSALSATLGLGNIAGVAIAIAAGGPGAVFWMWLSGFLGMSMKFCECTLSQVHRRIGKDGHVLGGPMVVIADGLGSWGGAWKPTAKVLAAAYAVFIICAAFGVALFQTKTSYGISAAVISPLQGQEVRWTFGVALALLVGIVIIGGIRRIGSVASKIVPAMCVFYVAVCLVIILANLADVPALIGSIFAEAFTGPAIYGGFIGVLIMGMRRGMFSNEAGIGSAAIAHAAARTREPVREGLVAMLGPFIDTIVICSMTALTILITAVHLQGEPGTTLEGAVLTATAFAEVHWMLGYCLVPAVLVFAYSTMISWSYYGDRGAEYLLGPRAVTPFRVFFVLLVLLGPMIGVANIVAFADITFFAAAFPNIIVMVLLSGTAAKMLADYRKRLASGEIRPTATIPDEAVNTPDDQPTSRP